MSRRLTEEEADRVVRFISGEMSTEESIRFEHDLADDDELSLIVDETQRLDGMLRDTDLRARPRGRLLALCITGAAAAAMIVATVVLQSPPSPMWQTGTRVALLESPPDFDRWLVGYGYSFADRPPSSEDPRGDKPATGDASKFMERALDVEGTRAEKALTSQIAEITASRFVVPVELPEQGWGMVLGVDEAGTVKRLFPSSLITDLGPDDFRLEAGRSVLPRPRVRLEAGGERVDYDFGYFLPLGSSEMTLWVVLSPASLSESALVQASDLLGEASGEEALQALREKLPEGAACHRLVVRRP